MLITIGNMKNGREEAGYVVRKKVLRCLNIVEFLMIKI